jgi:hypothetical protein
MYERSFRPAVRRPVISLTARSLTGHLKVTSIGTFYFRALLGRTECTVRFDENKNLSRITYVTSDSAGTRESVMRKTNPRYQVLEELAEAYNPNSVRARKSTSE